MLKVETDFAAAVEKLAAVPGRVDATLMSVARSESAKLADLVRAKLSGPVLKARSGELRASIKATIENRPGEVSWTVGSYGVPYAEIHEYGGKTPAHEILPVKGKALAFLSRGDYVVVKKVNHPGSVIPERSYLRSSADERMRAVVSAVVAAINQALE